MNIRKKMIAWLFKVTQEIYTKYFKKSLPWNITKSHLLNFSPESFGYKLGQFLNKNNFELIPKVERHDAYHIITGYNTAEEDEIALQYLCLGNGKRSFYLFGVIIIGSLILPEYYKYYYKSYHIGLGMNTFFNLNYKALLTENFETIISKIYKKKENENT